MTFLQRVTQRAFFDELAKVAWYTSKSIVKPAKFNNLEEAVQIKAEHDAPVPKMKQSNAHIKTTKPLPSIGARARQIR